MDSWIPWVKRSCGLLKPGIRQQHGQLAQLMEPDNLRKLGDKLRLLKALVMRAFREHCNFGLYTLKVYLVYQKLEDLHSVFTPFDWTFLHLRIKMWILTSRTGQPRNGLTSIWTNAFRWWKQVLSWQRVAPANCQEKGKERWRTRRSSSYQRKWYTSWWWWGILSVQNIT